MKGRRCGVVDGLNFDFDWWTVVFSDWRVIWEAGWVSRASRRGAEAMAFSIWEPSAAIDQLIRFLRKAARRRSNRRTTTTTTTTTTKTTST